jgi:hypothetical protein
MPRDRDAVEVDATGPRRRRQSVDDGADVIGPVLEARVVPAGRLIERNGRTRERPARGSRIATSGIPVERRQHPIPALGKTSREKARLRGTSAQSMREKDDRPQGERRRLRTPDDDATSGDRDSILDDSLSARRARYGERDGSEQIAVEPRSSVRHAV